MPEVVLHRDGANTGILRHGSEAIVINPATPGLWEALRQSGVRSVEHVLFTHHRRELADGWPELMAACRPQVHVPAAEESLFAHPASYWNDPKCRWQALCSHMPYHVTHTHPLEPDFTHTDGVLLEWHDWRIRVLATPGYTDGSITYLAEHDNRTVAFCGDLIYGPGRIRDLYCLQHHGKRNGHEVGDYHGFMGAMETVIDSLLTIREQVPEHIVPAHGVVMDRPADAIDLLVSRLRLAYHNYVSISALRWYFPRYFDGFSRDAETLPMQETFPQPTNVRRVCGNVWTLIARSGRALITDPYAKDAVDAVQTLLDKGEITGVDGIWITHYHSDHVQAAAYARDKFACPIITDRHIADIIERPSAYFLTCLVDAPATVDRVTEDGETWKWEDFTLSAYHFPGQTYYHAGLLAVADAGERYFFSGDSFTPTGIDDYCSWNRNFLGRDRGFDYCIRLMRSLRPDIIFNQHVEVGFRFTEQAYELMLANLAQRERLFADLLPWDHANFGTDEYWVHTYPYEQQARPGQIIPLQVRIMNHALDARAATVGLRTPQNWSVTPHTLTVTCAARIETGMRFEVAIPANAPPQRHVIPVTVIFDGENLGSFREAIIEIERI